MSIEGKIVKLSMLNRFYQELPNFFVRKETGKGLSTNDYTDAEKADVAKITDIETALDNKINGEIIEDGGGFVRGLKVVNDNDYSATLQLPPEGDGKIHFTLRSESTSDFILAQTNELTTWTYSGTGGTGSSLTLMGPEDASASPVLSLTKTANGITFNASHDNGTVTGISLTELTSKTYVDSAITDGITDALADVTGVDFVVVAANENLPATGVKGKFYLKATGATGNNKYDEYVWVNHGTAESPDYGYEKLGTMDVDLTGYIKESDLQFATTEDILAIFNSGGN